MVGWKLTFNYRGQGNVLAVELEGSEQAIRTGLTMAGLLAGARLKRLVESGAAPDELHQEAFMLYLIQQGSPCAPYEGKYLRVEPSAAGGGLAMQSHVEWND
jgi:hypothetical protein